MIFIAIYAAATVLFLPGAVVTLAGGALFGPVGGTLWNMTDQCASCTAPIGARRSAQAGSILAKAGFADVRVI